MVNTDLGNQQMWRRFNDRIARYSITLGGLMVLITLLMIFGYLGYVIEPVFRSAKVTQVSEYPQSFQGGLISVGTDEYTDYGYYLDQQGVVQFYSLAKQTKTADEKTIKLAADVTPTTFSKVGHTVGIGTDQGAVVVAQPSFTLDYSSGQRQTEPTIIYPLSELPIPVDPDQQPLIKLALQLGEEQASFVAQTRDKRLVVNQVTREENFMTEEISLVNQFYELQGAPSNVQHLLVSPDQRLLFIVDANLLYIYHLSETGAQKPREIVDINSGTGQVTTIALLSGGSSLLIGNDQGKITQWFEVVDKQGRHLQQVREFFVNGAVKDIETEASRKTFAVLSQDNHISLFHSTSEAELLSFPLTKPVVSMAFSPRNDALVLGHQASISVVKLENEHPEVSWSALWNEVWYEGYAEPDYVWQSTSASDEFEPKLSLVPISFGTLKAAFYAMLFAVPIAVAGAIYTAYFMPANLRQVIKPTVEMMEALPTVILGFLAGLWLAPLVETHLVMVFLLIFVVPVGVIAFSYLYAHLPSRLAQIFPEKHCVLYLVPLILLLAYACSWLGGLIEALWMGGDARLFVSHELGIDFDQRNALIVGLAMGFAVIPTIYSIAEDAIFSVPEHVSNGSLALGATRWQTLVGVVLLIASPGIFSAVMMGLGRAVGETMIVLMATGNTPIMDWNIFEGMRTLSANVAVEMPESEVGSTHYRVLFLAAFVLFIFTFIFNTVAELVRQRLREKYGALS